MQHRWEVGPNERELGFEGVNGLLLLSREWVSSHGSGFLIDELSQSINQSLSLSHTLSAFLLFTMGWQSKKTLAIYRSQSWTFESWEIHLFSLRITQPVVFYYNNTKWAKPENSFPWIINLLSQINGIMLCEALLFLIREIHSNFGAEIKDFLAKKSNHQENCWDGFTVCL